MTPPRDWPPYASPPWIAAYAAGLCAWLAIWQLWGVFGVLALFAGGVWLGLVVGEAMHRYPGGDGS